MTMGSLMRRAGGAIDRGNVCRFFHSLVSDRPRRLPSLRVEPPGLVHAIRTIVGSNGDKKLLSAVPLQQLKPVKVGTVLARFLNVGPVLSVV